MTKISNQYSLTNVLTADPVNGRVGIGTASPSELLTISAVQPNSVINYTSASDYGRIYFSEAGTFKASIQFMGSTFAATSRRNALEIVNTTTGDLALGTGDARTFYIKNGGNVGIGTDSPLNVTTNRTSVTINGTSTSILSFGSGGVGKAYIFNDGTNLETYSAGALIYNTAGTERMRITSGGNVGIGTTTPGSKLQIGTMASYTGGGYTFAMSNGSTDFLITVNGAQTGSSVTFYSSTDYYFNRSGPSSTGIINAYGFNNVSDYRLKYDLESFDGLSLISQIKTYKYKMEETHETQYGVLAHEIQEVLPHLVVGVKDGDRMQSVDYQKIVPMLIKSVQEQQLQINELKALLNA